jgi:Zn-finger nucleic acid-binding protein
MNRINFARCSGVIVDFCKQHGTWFDRDELSSIVQFINDGGLNASRAREKIEIAEQRDQLRQAQRTADLRSSGVLGISEPDEPRLAGIASARGLLKFLLE